MDESKPISHADLVKHFAGRKGKWAGEIDRGRDDFMDDLPKLLEPMIALCAAPEPQAMAALASLRRALIELRLKALGLSYDPADWPDEEKGGK